MTRANKYNLTKKQVKELIKEIKKYLECPYEGGPCTKSIENFFNEQFLINITEDEKVILKNIDKKYIRIYRDNTPSHRLMLMSEYDEQGNRWCANLGINNNLFKFILPGEEYIISELLEEEE